MTAIELPQLEAVDARRLLTRGQPLSTTDAQVAEDICKLLGCHALAVDVTAALVERRGLEAVREALQHPDRDALALAAQFEEVLPNGHQRQIAATFLASIEQLDEPARELLRIAAVLAVAPIPSRLLKDVVVAADGTDEGAVQDRVDLAIDKLLSASLADDAGDFSINVHTLVSRTVRTTESSPERRAALRAHLVGVLAAEMVRAADIREHGSLAPWVTHARELSGTPKDTEIAALLGRVARFDFERASYFLATQGFERQLEANKLMLGEEHPDTLTTMDSLAGTLRSRGDLPGAKRLHETALEAMKRVLGQDHPGTLSAMINLAETLRAQGDLPGARHLQEAVLEARKRVLGEEHPDTLRSMNNLAGTLEAQGDPASARRLQEAVLMARRRLLGEDHPSTLSSMNNLALTLLAQGDLPGARRLQESVLEASIRVLGEEHPDTLTGMNNLAATLRAQGDLPGARRLQEAVLVTSKRVRGEEHPHTLISMNNLAITLWRQGEMATACHLLELAAAGSLKTLGGAHPNTEATLKSLQQIRDAAAANAGDESDEACAFPADTR